MTYSPCIIWNMGGKWYLCDKVWIPGWLYWSDFFKTNIKLVQVKFSAAKVHWNNFLTTIFFKFCWTFYSVLPTFLNKHFKSMPQGWNIMKYHRWVIHNSWIAIPWPIPFHYFSLFCRTQWMKFHELEKRCEVHLKHVCAGSYNFKRLSIDSVLGLF